MPEKLKTCREYSEAARDSKEERGETKLSLIFMYKLKWNEERIQMGDADLNERWHSGKATTANREDG